MTTRELRPDEWSLLSETEMAPTLAKMSPENARVVVVEHEGRIVGAWAVLKVVHLEGVWIAPEYRKRGSVARRLKAATLDVAREWASWAMTGAQSKDVAALLVEHLGAVHVPMDTYIVPLESVCQ